MRILAIIPARAGSVGLPHKNRLKLGNKSLVEWALECGLNAKAVDTVMLNTDDEVLIEETKGRPGIDVPFKRPAELATSISDPIDMVLYTLDWYESKGVSFDGVALLQPTCPFRQSSELDEAIEQWQASDRATLVSVCEPTQHPADCIAFDGEGWQSCLPRMNGQNTRRQDFNEVLFINGAIYVSAVSWLRSQKTFYQLGESILYKMPAISGIDIDDALDLKMANAMVEYFCE